MARHDPAPRQHRGAGRGHHDASPRVGGLGPRRELHRPPDRLPAVQAPVPRRPDSRGEPQGRRNAPTAVPRPAHRGAQVQPDVHHAHGPGRGRGRADLPQARDRAGHLRELQERAADRPGEGALRHRPGRQGVPQRDHHEELHLPHVRVRADGDAVLRAPLRGHEVVRALEGEALPVLPRPRHQEVEAALPPARSRRAGPLRQGRLRHPVRVPVRLEGAGGHPQPHRLRPEAPHRVLGQGPLLPRRGVEGALHPLHHRDLRGPDPHGARGALRRLRRGRGGGREARGAALPPPDRPDHGGRLPAGEEGRPGRAGAQARRRAVRGVPHVLRRGRGHRPPVPPAGRGRDAVLRHRGLPVQGGPDRHRAVPRQHAAGAGEDGRGGRHAAARRSRTTGGSGSRPWAYSTP